MQTGTSINSATTTQPVPPQPVLDEATRSFVKRSLAAGLVEVSDLKKVVVSLMAESLVFSPERLAGGLVGAGILTQWQATKLLSGKSKGFYLGSYRLLRPLGRGGMGVVYLGEHHVMKRLMALKILPPEASGDARRIKRFQDEAKACAQLDHPNIVRAYDFSQASGKLYIVMEYVDGIDLHQAVARDGKMSVAEAMDALTQAAAGLAHAHERGIIHRDIKPSNLMLRTDGVLKVSDLGLARIGWTDGEDESRRLMGTADFVAPEQAINSQSVDARADIYSLGCSLYFLLTGRAPFDGTTVAQRLAKHQTAAVPDVRQRRPDCPAGVAELLMRMMAKRPEDRPKSAVELISQLKRFGGLGTDSNNHPLRHVAPASDTAIDEMTYQATIDDSSLSSDGEVEIVADESVFDFGDLPPVDMASVVMSKPVAIANAGPIKPKSVAGERNSPTSNGSASNNQQVLLGVGLAFAMIALVAVIGLGFISMSRPLPQAVPKIKVTEGGKDGSVIILQQP
ncbi:serine/threonine-protein kinase [Rubripirellula reticaptiva]|uniref:Serine/threonine-protein kinase PrkC n=1 Tax=Rubripirellula reticaptiva TaxID=2528013 RepID=A0A5C6FCI2_9BACT|nr:serine/threonine-protein kinase [Rubripirellula reticaptiva]TWU57291.1 Serine/threonine-protein kinase PrkC [Rubripirellula reticaptiva]